MSARLSVCARLGGSPEGKSDANNVSKEATQHDAAKVCKCVSEVSMVTVERA